MKNTPINRDTIDVIDILINQNDYINLNNIIKILNTKKTYIRTLQRILNSLINNKRIIQEGVASSTKYRIENIERFHKKRVEELYSLGWIQKL